MEIAYLDEFYELKDRSTFKGEQWFGERQRLVETYSWAVPTRDVINYCAQFDKLIEVGAGSGYWAHLIDEAGGTVLPIDSDPPSETYCYVEEYSAAEYAESISDMPVLMVWPPAKSDMAYTVIDQRPPHICYVGEERGGCTGSDVFFDIIQREYGLVGRLELPSYAGVSDDFYHYVRKI